MSDLLRELVRILFYFLNLFLTFLIGGLLCLSSLLTLILLNLLHIQINLEIQTLSKNDSIKEQIIFYLPSLSNIQAPYRVHLIFLFTPKFMRIYLNPQLLLEVLIAMTTSEIICSW